MATKKKLIVINDNEFIPCYIDFLKNLCIKNDVDIDIINSDEISPDMCSEDTYLYSDSFPIEGCVKVFHQQTIRYRMNKDRNIFYKIIYYLAHLKEIKETYKLNRSYKKLICVSNEVKRDLEKYYEIPSEKMIVAHAGFVPPVIDNDDKQFVKFKDDEVFTICTSAFGFVTKGGYTLLEALRHFRKMYPDVKIKANIIYPKYKTNLGVKLYVNLFKLNDMVEFFGFQDDINKFYNKAHCLTCQSVYEAFGRIVTEAMYQKIPVILGSHIGAADIIEDDVNGFIYKDGKNAAKNLAMKIKYVYDKYNDLEPIVEKAYNTSKSLTWENFANEVFYGLYPEFKA